LCVLRVGSQGSSGQQEATIPDSNTPSNILHYTQTARFNTQSNITAGAISETFTKVRTLWRGLDMMGQAIIAPNPVDLGTLYRIQQASTPFMQTQSRHVRVRTSCRLNEHEGLFLVTEVVNPFQADNPTIALDLFGSCVIKTNFYGPAKYETTV